MTDREIFKRNLGDIMNATKSKQIDIARYAEVSYQTVSAWVTGRAYPRADAMEKLCRFFGVKQSALTEEKNIVNDEDRILSAFRALSPKGQEKLFERAAELKRLYPKRSSKNGEA
jgi:transcriptional regulator with XRE-family HTH domain